MGDNFGKIVRRILTDRLSAARAGYLDELAAANLPTDITALATSQGRMLFLLDFESEVIEEISLTQAAATLPVALAAWDVVVANIPAGATVVIAKAFKKFGAVENINVAVNSLDGATVAGTSQVIQVETDAPGTWRDAINFSDNQYSLTASTREGSNIFFGTPNIAVEVTGNGTYHFRWLLSKANQDNLNFNDVQMGLKIWISV